MVVGEAPGDEETCAGKPFVGPSGHELRRMAATVGLDLASARITNVFSRQPAQNSLALFGTEGPPAPGLPTALGPLTTAPRTFLSPEHEHEIIRLHAEVAETQPNLLLLLGNTASWAFGLGLGIKALRGTLHSVDLGLPRPIKCLPTYHPAAIIRQWDLRVIAIADLQKAANEIPTPDLTFDNTTLWLAPTEEDLLEFDNLHMSHATLCAVDIETKRGQITCISFAPTPEHSLVIPFWIEDASPSYWPSIEAERRAWGYVIKWMERPDLTKVFQNGLYDLQYLQHYCRPQSCTEDTMLAHHSLFSELPKDLGFLGSIFANVPGWKKMRTFNKSEIFKRDD
jgi:uracil-DNA glycosylase